MKKKSIVLILSIIVCLSLSIPASAVDKDDYGQGYQDGYKAGYQYQSDGGIKPIAPIAPIPPIANIGESGYDDGYTRGIIEGREQRQKREY